MFWAIVGFGVIAFVLLGIGILLLGFLDLMREGVRDVRDRRARARSSAEHRRAQRREEDAWAAEKAALERERLAFVLDETNTITSAATGGDFIVTGHRDGGVRLRSRSGGGGVVGGFSTGYERAVQTVALSEDGGLVVTAERFEATGEVRGTDGDVRGTVSPGPSAALRSWDATADDSDGYLHLNEYLQGFAFGPDVAGGDLLLTAVWRYRYGPDGGPGPIYGSGAVLARRFRLPADGPPRLVSEALSPLGHGASAEQTTFAPDGAVVIGSRWRTDLMEPGVAGARPMRQEVGWPLVGTPDGRLLVSTPPAGRYEASESARSALAVWEPLTGEKIHAWEDAVLSFGPAAALNPDASGLAVTAREPRSAANGPRERTFVRLYEVRTGGLVGRLPAAPILLAFSPDGGLLFTVEAGGVKAWRV